MRQLQFANQATSKLAANISAGDTALSVLPGDGAKFPSLSGAQYFTATLVKSTGAAEIVKVTARSGDTFTIVRAYEKVGNAQTALSFTAGDRVELRLSAKALGDELDRLKPSHAVLNKSANYTVSSGASGTASDNGNLIRVSTGAADVTITLPLLSALADDFEVIVSKVTSDTHKVKIACSGPNTINGLGVYELADQYASAWLVADRAGGTWTAVTSGGGGTPASVMFTDAFTGNGTANPLTLSGIPADKNSTIFLIGGVPQYRSTYTLTGNQLTPGAAIPSGAAIEVWWWQRISVFVRDQFNVRDFGAVGDGVTDDTAAIATAITAAAGGELDFGGGHTYLVSATLELQSQSTYKGRSRIKAKNGAGIAGAMLHGNACFGTKVVDLEIDGNKTNNGAKYGLWFVGGAQNIGVGLYVHDTIQAGAVVEGESGTFVDKGYYLNCGDNTGTDNHAIMIISTSTSNEASGARGVRVKGAYRKGITGYTGVGGSVKYLSVVDCKVSDCGLGGIYLANAPGATDQEEVTLSGNTCWNNYVNFQISNIKRLAGAANISLNSTASGVIIDHCTDAVLPAFMIADSGVEGLKLTSCVNIALGVVNIRRSNRSMAGFGPALSLTDSTYCTFAPGSIIYDETPRTTHGIIEQGACDYNDFDGITVSGVTAALYTIVGANTRIQTRSGRFTGLGAITPLNMLDINGGLTRRVKQITLVSGANNDVTLPTDAGTMYTTGISGVFSITGIAGGHTGREIRIVNYSGSPMTISYNSVSSAAGNRILNAANADLIIPSLGSVDLTWIPGPNAWFATAAVISTQGAHVNTTSGASLAALEANVNALIVSLANAKVII